MVCFALYNTDDFWFSLTLPYQFNQKIKASNTALVQKNSCYLLDFLSLCVTQKAVNFPSDCYSARGKRDYAHCVSPEKQSDTILWVNAHIWQASLTKELIEFGMFSFIVKRTAQDIHAFLNQCQIQVRFAVLRHLPLLSELKSLSCQTRAEN